MVSPLRLLAIVPSLVVSSFKHVLERSDQAPTWQFVFWSITQRLQDKVNNGLLLKTSATSSVKSTVGKKKLHEAANLPEDEDLVRMLQEASPKYQLQGCYVCRFVTKASPTPAHALLCSQWRFGIDHAHFTSDQSHDSCRPRCVEKTARQNDETRAKPSLVAEDMSTINVPFLQIIRKKLVFKDFHFWHFLIFK